MEKKYGYDWLTGCIDGTANTDFEYPIYRWKMVSMGEKYKCSMNDLYEREYEDDIEYAIIIDSVVGYQGGEPERSVSVHPVCKDGSGPNDIPITEAYVRDSETIDDVWERELAEVQE